MPYQDNLYPSGLNYPVPSFRQGVTPPDVDPDEGELIIVAYNPDWIPVLMAACNQLLQYSTWLGDHDALILATERAANLKVLLQQPAELPTNNYDTPYWDDETDVDDSEPPDEEDWYGEVEDALAPAPEMTFSQNAVIWLLTGFVAIATVETGPGAVAAAVAFRTVAKRFVLAFNRGDIREQFRIIIDQTDYGQVDTNGASPGDIFEMTVNGLDDTEDHEILIVVTNPEEE